MSLPPEIEAEECAKLITRVQVLERELFTRQALKEADHREPDEVAADEILERIEASVRGAAADWESGSEDEGEDEDRLLVDSENEPEKPLKGAMGTVLRYSKNRINRLSTLTVLVRYDADLLGEQHHLHHSGIGEDILDDKSNEVLVEISEGMTFRSIMELVSEYWGISPESTIHRLVDERGTWHRLDMAVHSAIRPSRREHPVLFLQRRKGLDEVLRKSEYGIVDDFGLDTSLKAVGAAPVVALEHVTDAQTQGGDGTNVGSVHHQTTDVVVGDAKGLLPVSKRTRAGVLALTNASVGMWTTDVVLFTWRRVACDFILTLVLFIMICVYLALAPRYTEARGASMMISNSLINVGFPSPPLDQPLEYALQRFSIPSAKDIETWDEFWSWMEGPVTSVFTSSFFPDRQSLLFGPVRLRQNRVKNATCPRPDLPTSLECFPAFSSSTAKTDPWFRGTPFVKNSVRSIAGVFGDYPADAYLVDVHPLALANSTNCTTLLDATNTFAICGEGSNATGTCWDCVVGGLQKNEWTDDGSRLVMMQFLVYSGNANIFIDSQFAFELSVTGITLMTYEINILTVQAAKSNQTIAFVIVVSILIAIIGLQFLQTFAFIRRTFLDAKAMDTQGVVSQSRVSFLLRICWALPTRFTLWNPVIFVLCAVGLSYVNQVVPAPTVPPGTSLDMIPFQTIQSVGNQVVGEIILGVANMAVAYKLSTYFEFTSRFLVYFLDVAENLLMLCVTMTVTVCSFAWLLSVTASASNLSISTSFGESFVFVVRMLMNQVSATEFQNVGEDMWFPLSFVFYASQIVLNLVLVRIAAPICYEALIKEGSAADYLLESLQKVSKSTQHWIAT